MYYYYRSWATNLLTSRLFFRDWVKQQQTLFKSLKMNTNRRAWQGLWEVSCVRSPPPWSSPLSWLQKPHPMFWEGSVIKSYPMRGERPRKNGDLVLDEVKRWSILQTNESRRKVTKNFKRFDALSVQHELAWCARKDTWRCVATDVTR